MGLRAEIVWEKFSSRSRLKTRKVGETGVVKTEVFRVEGVEGRREVLARAGKLLREGGIVGFPTETVYGLGASAEQPGAVARLYEVKNRPKEKAFTVHIADARQVEDLVEAESIGRVGRRLMARCWPGPLTIVFERKKGTQKSIAIRLADHEVARELIREAGCLVLGTSANLSGEPPVRTAQEVLAVFEGKIEAVVDGGRTRLGESSTVVRLKGEGYEVLREGVISAQGVRRAMNRSVLFVCSGNSCRSPMAEAIFRKLLAEKLGVRPEELSEHGHDVSSAGTGGGFARPASVEARQVAEELGMDLSNHLSQTVNRRMLEAADEVYVMTPEQMEQVLEVCAEAQGRVMLLDPKGRVVADPHGGDLETYRRCAFVIRKALQKRIERL